MAALRDLSAVPIVLFWPNSASRLRWSSFLVRLARSARDTGQLLWRMWQVAWIFAGCIIANTQTSPLARLSLESEHGLTKMLNLSLHSQKPRESCIEPG